MNAVAVAKARATLAELRELLPRHAGAIDALARKLEAAAERSGRTAREGRLSQPGVGS